MHPHINLELILPFSPTTFPMTLRLSKVSDSYFDKLFVAKNNTALNLAIKARVLLVDRYTTPIVSMCYTQSQLLQHEVVLIETLENHSSLHEMKHLNCIVYIRPTKELIVLLSNELRAPHFHHYQVFFNNTVAKTQLEKIAEADSFEIINQVVELFQDYLIVNDNLYSIGLPAESAMAGNNGRIVEEASSIVSLLLSLKKTPVIKFEPNSVELKKLSSEILYNINSNSNNNLFDDLNKNSDVPPVLLLLDRKNDPVTPLVTPWTYQSMVHELIGITRNIVDLKEAKEQVVLSESQDAFYRESLYLNYGDLTDKFQHFVDDYKRQTKQSSVENLKTQNLAELKKVLTKFPEFRKLSTNILKHLNLISELDSQISAQNLWVVGELQQVILCGLESAQTIRTKLLEVLDNPAISTPNKVKLVLIYVAKYPNNLNELSIFLSKMNDPSKMDPLPTQSQLALVQKFNKMFGSTALKNNDNNSNNIGNIFNKKININLLFSNNNDQQHKTDNIYMQYIPKLNETLNTLINPPTGQNQTRVHPELLTLVPERVEAQYGSRPPNAVQDIIIYVKGGVTYEESRLIHDLSAANSKVNLIIGGDTILNSSMWLERMYDMVNGGTEEAAGVRRTQFRDIL